MKNITLSVLVLVVGGFFATAIAQDRVLARADVPFNFAAHGQELPAGRYELRQIGAQVVRLQDLVTGQGVTLLTNQTIGESSTTNVLFRCYGNRHFLANVIAQSYQISVPKSRWEKQAEASHLKSVTVRLQVQR